jgi:hypothetical protein
VPALLIPSRASFASSVAALVLPGMCVCVCVVDADVLTCRWCGVSAAARPGAIGGNFGKLAWLWGVVAHGHHDLCLVYSPFALAIAFLHAAAVAVGIQVRPTLERAGSFSACSPAARHPPPQPRPSARPVECEGRALWWEKMPYLNKAHAMEIPSEATCARKGGLPAQLNGGKPWAAFSPTHVGQGLCSPSSAMSPSAAPPPCGKTKAFRQTWSCPRTRAPISPPP